MGMNADVLCIGKFRKETAKYLDYPEEDYNDTKDDSIVTSHLFNCNTADASRKLASALGIDDPYNFSLHRINSIKQVNLNDLVDLSEQVGEWDPYEEYNHLRVLLEKDFLCLFQPNY